MMTFKEACTYSNYLGTLIGNIEYLTQTQSNYVKKTEVHLKNASNPDEKDETLVSEQERIFKGQIQDIVHLASTLIDEKLKLAIAIEAAKKVLTIDFKENNILLSIDTAVEYNKNIRTLATSYLERLTTAKPISGVKMTGRGYKFNVAGDQVPYTYSIEASTELDFDKVVVKDLYKKLLNKADRISTLLDDAHTKNVVDYVKPYDIHDTMEEVIEAYQLKRAETVVE